MSVNTLNANTIKQIPVVFGEADLVKTITLLPGTFLVMVVKALQDSMFAGDLMIKI